MSESESGEKDGFLRGWSRRKIEANRREAPEEAVAPVEDQAEPVSEAEIPDLDLVAALPSLDEITAGFDIKPFLAKGIPAHLKNAALRRLWSVSPSVSQYSDPAVDYAWDWNAPGGVPGGGGILSEQSVAKMVKDLIGGRPDPEDESTVADASATDLETEEVAELSSDAENPASVRLDERAGQPRSPAAQTATEQARHDDPARHDATPPKTRRHGGALPE